MSRRRVVVVVVLSAVAGALLLTTRGAADRPKRSVENGVVRVESSSCGRTMLGSGFVVDRRHVVTAAHVVDEASAIALTRDGRVVARGTIVGADAARDVALIRLDRSIRASALTLSRRAPKPGDAVVAAGYPHGGPLTMARGSLRGTATTVPSSGVLSRPLIQTDAFVSHGESGGPLVSGADGEVLGMLDMSSTREGGPGFAVGTRDLAPLVARWRSDPEAVPQRPCRASSGGYPTLPQPSPLSGAASPPPAHM
jgi:S1-C subfamily serine protease